MNAKLAELLYGTTDADQIVKVKTAEPQKRAFAGGAGKVTLTEAECRKLCRNTNDLEFLSGYENRVRQYTITDETVDRYGDIVRAKGAVLDNFKKNPVLQFAHNYEQPPVGNAIKVWHDKETNAVKAWGLFFDDRMDKSGRSDMIFRLVSANAMRACSIGFMPMEFVVPKSAEEASAMGLGKYGIDFTKWDLMEFSPCPVPANPSALQDSIRNDFQAAKFAKTLRDGNFTARDVSLLKEYPLFDQEVLDLFVKELGNPIISVSQKIADILEDNENPEVPEVPEVPIIEGVLLEAAEAAITNISIKATFEAGDLVKDIAEVNSKIEETRTLVKSLTASITEILSTVREATQAAEAQISEGKQLYDVAREVLIGK